jgi:hypothetical protein
VVKKKEKKRKFINAAGACHRKRQNKHLAHLGDAYKRIRIKYRKNWDIIIFTVLVTCVAYLNIFKSLQRSGFYCHHLRGVI